MTSRQLLALTLGVCASASTLSFAQNPVAFNPVNSSSSGIPLSAYAIDVNNDGVPDIVQDVSYSPGVFTVSLGKGDGTFAAPVSYKVPATNGAALVMTSADFNNDGKLDIAVAPVGASNLYVFLGNGDGTFQAPKTETPALPSGQQLSGPLAASDFNHDGKTDLVVTSTANTVYVLAGDAAGHFANPVAVFTAPSGETLGDLTLGDFDSDNNVDIALDYYHSTAGHIDQTVAEVFYGDGQLGFQGQWIQSFSGVVNIGSGYLDDDPRTDLFAINYSTNQLATFYGSSSGRNFDAYYYTIPAAEMPTRVPGYSPAIAVADFNDDNYRKDLVTVASTQGQQSLIFFLSNGTRGQFVPQKVNLPAGYYQVTGPLLGDFNNDTKPDVAVVQSSTTGAPGPSSTAIISAEINGTSGAIWSDCNYPRAGQGIYLCGPIGYSSPLMEIWASANSFNTIRKMELWVDGVKYTEQNLGWAHNSFLYWAQELPDGWHNATLFATDIDDRMQRLNFGFSTGTSYPCPVPTQEGIHVCYPTQSSLSPSDVNVQASANVGAASVYRIEVWVDGVKKFTNFNAPYISADIHLAPGAHRFDFYAVSYDGTKWEQTVYASTK